MFCLNTRKGTYYLLNMKYENQKRYILLLAFSLMAFFSFAQSPFSVVGGNGTPFQALNENRMEVYLLYGLNNAQISYTGDGQHVWYKYRENANEAIPIPCVQNGNVSSIDNIESGYGYFVGSNLSSSTNYIWIIDYSRYLPVFSGIYFEEEESDRCEVLKITLQVDAENLSYKTPTGVTRNVARQYELTYQILKWDDESKQFLTETKTDILRGILTEYVIDAPLLNTTFTLTGDHFSKHFGKEASMQTDEYEAVAVEAHAVAEWDSEKAGNDISKAGENLGGSAPKDFTFTAYANEPVANRYTWKVFFYNLQTGTKDLKVSFSDKTLRYTFSESGTYEVKLEVDDRNYLCVDSTQTFNVFMDETQIIIPNVFSPGSSIGVNDEFKVGFTSLLSFKASIFNRWGNLLYEWSDPTKGWDGRVHGKFVPTGVYFIIVEYTDTTGKKKTKSSDINIIRSKN